MRTGTKLGGGTNLQGMGSNKLFITEYKLAFKDPTPFIRKGGSKKGASHGKGKGKQQSKSHASGTSSGTTATTSLAAGGQGDTTVVKKEELVLPAIPGAATTAENKARSKSKKDLWAPVPVDSTSESTSLNLPGMLTSHHSQVPIRRKRILGGISPTGHSHTARYNIISGAEILGENHTGYKEGRRAVILTFAHIDSTTNARTPGYNIISNRDYYSDYEGEH